MGIFVIIDMISKVLCNKLKRVGVHGTPIFQMSYAHTDMCMGRYMFNWINLYLTCKLVCMIYESTLDNVKSIFDILSCYYY